MANIDRTTPGWKVIQDIPAHSPVQEGIACKFAELITAIHYLGCEQGYDTERLMSSIDLLKQACLRTITGLKK